MNLPKIVLEAKARRYVYNVGLATLLTAAAYNVVEHDKVPVLEALLAAVVGLARRNVRD